MPSDCPARMFGNAATLPYRYAHVYLRDDQGFCGLNVTTMILLPRWTISHYWT